MTRRVRNWCFTLHLTQQEEDNYADLPHERLATKLGEGLRYAVWQLERCPSTGRLHYQGYAEFRVSIRFGTIKERMGSTVHLECRKGSRAQAVEYCKKPESRVLGPWEFGSPPTPGRRTDLDAVAERIQGGDDLRAVVQDFPGHYIRYRRGMEALHAMVHASKVPVWREVTVVVLHGPAGSGKTKRAVQEGGDDFFILDQGERVWFDGYSGQSTLIVDDFYGWVKYGQLLRILDGHPYRCEVKGSFVQAAWTKVFITSNKPPEEWYANGLTPALSRRISEIIYVPLVAEDQEGDATLAE